MIEKYFINRTALKDIKRKNVYLISLPLLLMFSIILNVHLTNSFEHLKNRYVKLHNTLQTSADKVEFEEVLVEETKYPWSNYYIQLRDTSWTLSDKLYKNKGALIVSTVVDRPLDIRLHSRYWGKLNERIVYLIYSDDTFFKEAEELLSSYNFERLQGKITANGIFLLFLILFSIIQVILGLSDYRYRKSIIKNEPHQITFEEYFRSLSK